MGSYLIDPPNGHAFGFPKKFTGDLDALDIDAWLRDRGYPAELLAAFPKGQGCRILFDADAANSTKVPQK
jgi:hypothetical protein